MSKYRPDNWVVIHIKSGAPHYRVLAGWSGGYLDGDSWRMNSGITRVEVTDEGFDFYGSSGSCYSCHKSAYGLRMNTAPIWGKVQAAYDVELMDEATDWTIVEWT